MTEWLDEDEMAAWLPLIRIVQALPQALDRRLREEAGIPHNYYGMLATLSARADRTLTMGELARLTASSPSRLSHAVTGLEQRGWVVRKQCPEDKRRQFVTLTDAGQELLDRVAPSHVEHVRDLVFSRLSPEQVRQLAQIAATIVGNDELGEA
ncbi:MarR family winged helix-turn-helix transcriptional regulator [Nocardioides sp. LML1-1-1.1]|uniref:MarR family winged helix-turn-helix transcriptional regulator n=1 Tax=Nocardioides sp. LML1-1-1.1 TaxID=3135248 RepID=UPI0034452CE4